MEYDTISATELQPLHDHQLYLDGMAQISAGQWQQATNTFQLLQGIYPDEVEVKKLFDEAHMRATLARFQPRHRSKGQTGPLLRRFITGMLILLIVAIATYTVYELWIGPVILQELRVSQSASLRSKADEALAAGNYALARQSLQQLQAILPEDLETTEALQRIERVEHLAELYAEGTQLLATGRWNEAVEVLTELKTLDAQYRDVSQLLATAQESQTLDKQFQAAEETFTDGEWLTAIARLEALQQANLTFRFEEIQTRLFESHLRYGQQLVKEANNDPNQVAEALTHFSQALKYSPMDGEALQARHLAETYLAALNSSDRSQRIDLLQTIYNQQPEYGGQEMVQLLYTSLVEQAALSLSAGDKAAAITDYQAAARLKVEDPSEAQQKLAELASE